MPDAHDFVEMARMCNAQAAKRVILNSIRAILGIKSPRFKSGRSDSATAIFRAFSKCPLPFIQRVDRPTDMFVGIALQAGTRDARRIDLDSLGRNGIKGGSIVRCGL